LQRLMFWHQKVTNDSVRQLNKTDSHERHPTFKKLTLFGHIAACWSIDY